MGSWTLLVLIQLVYRKLVQVNYVELAPLLYQRVAPKTNNVTLHGRVGDTFQSPESLHTPTMLSATDLSYNCILPTAGPQCKLKY